MLEIRFYQSFATQCEILPRLTVIYFKTDKGIAFEWLWFGLSIFYAGGSERT